MDYVDQLGPAIKILSEIIKKYKYGNNLEIKVSIGIFESGRFRYGLHSLSFFNKVKDLLESNEKWISKDIQKIYEIIFDQYKSKDSKLFKINNLHILDLSFENTPFDIRIDVTSEIETNEKINSIYEIKREKIIYSYVSSDYKFNLVHILQTIDNITEDIYEFEIILLNLKNEVSDIYRSHSVLLKIRDIINHCETITTGQVTMIPSNSDSSVNEITITGMTIN